MPWFGICGVSGSGKSTLVQNVLVPALLKAKGQPAEEPGEFDNLLGAENVLELIFVDQSPIGKTTRSNPAIFSGSLQHDQKYFCGYSGSAFPWLLVRHIQFQPG